MTFVAALQIAIATALLDSLWQATLLGITAWFVLLLLEGRSAVLRHTVAMAFLIACVVAPTVTLVRVLTAAALPAVVVAPDIAGVAPPAALAWVWCIGVAWKLVRLASDWSAFRRLEADAFERLPSEWHDRAERLRLRFGIGRSIDIRLVAGVLPCSARLLRPVIWLPATLLTRMAPDQIEAILAHELAHIRRLDWLWNGIQGAIETLFFYHPAVWWLSRRIRQERENACDDLAATACGDPIVLAEALGQLQAMRTPTLVLSSQGGSLMKRISRLLMPEAKRPARWGLPAAALALLGVGAVLALQSGSAAGSDNPRWWQLHGDAMQINGTVAGEQRGYTRWRDSKGQQHERYLVNGFARPIDAAARAWVDRTAAVPLPPKPPAPPHLRPITDDSLYQNAVRQLAADPALVAQLGAPVAVEGIGGPSYMDQSRVNLTLRVSGPKGRARLHRTGAVADGQWTFRTADIEPLGAISAAR